MSYFGSNDFIMQMMKFAILKIELLQRDDIVCGPDLKVV